MCGFYRDLNDVKWDKKPYVDTWWQRATDREFIFAKSADTDNLQNRYVDYRHFADSLPIGKIYADVEAYLQIFILSADLNDSLPICQDNEKYGQKEMMADYADIPSYLQMQQICRYDDMRKLYLLSADIYIDNTV